jgi:hypothetical protein
MKNPRPAPPSDAPIGTVTIGGPIGWFSLSLHVTADDLNPDTVSELLRVKPTASQTKSVPLLREDGTVKRIPKFGRWTLQIKAEETDEWDIEEIILALFDRLPSELDTWHKVSAHGIIHLSIGLSLSTSSEGFSLKPDLMVFLGERDVRLDFDVYRKEF